MTEPNEGPNAAGSRVECVACGMTKKPVGRSAGLEAANGYCDGDCPGYRCRPLPGSLWPGETREQFGYACSTAKELEGVGPIYEEPRR